MPSYAVVRAVPQSFGGALVREALTAPLDVAKARAQHQAYCDALRAMGLELIALPPLEAYPDCCFVEDCAIVASGTALLTRPGAPSRRGEVETVAASLAPHLRLERTGAPATLDGGDCLRVGRRWYVGRSERTNAAGAARVREVFGPLGYEVVEVPVAGALHLKSVCSALGGRVVLARGTIPQGTFAEEVLLVDEAVSANVVEHGPRVLLPEGLPAARRALERLGLRVLTVDNSELRRADSALTCLSLCFDA